MMSRSAELHFRHNSPAARYAIGAVIGVANMMTRRNEAGLKNGRAETDLICFATDVAVATCGGGWRRLPPPSAT